MFSSNNTVMEKSSFAFSYHSSTSIGFAHYPTAKTNDFFRIATTPSATATTPAAATPGANTMAPTAKQSGFSPDGNLFAWISLDGLYLMNVDDNLTLDISSLNSNPQQQQQLQHHQKQLVVIPVKKAVEFCFSPHGAFISTFERLIRVEDGQAQHANVNVWNCSTGERLASFSHKNPETWRIQWTDDEKYFGRMVKDQVHFHDIKDPLKAAHKLQLEGLAGFSISPGKNPCVAVFIPERKGKPAIVRLFGLFSFNYPLSNKTFFKAEEIEFKWNAIGTNVLVLTRTITDKTGQSYYGETSLYYLSAVGNYDCRVALDAIGPVHDISWGPSGNEFIVVYGNVPAKAALFDSRANKIFDFGASAKNFVRYSPRGRLVLLAGFGNLAGYIEIWDRQNLVKITTFKEEAAVYCEFTPDGTNILTATLSPRLRVDNRFTIRNYKGDILWRQEFKELFSVALRPGPAYSHLSKEDSTTFQIVADSVGGQTKKSAAYVPPHLRNKQNNSGSSSATSSSSSLYHKPTATTTNGIMKANPNALPDSASVNEKQIKVIERKLKQIAQLKEKQQAGEVLEKNQVDKIDSEFDLLDQLAQLQRK